MRVTDAAMPVNKGVPGQVVAGLELGRVAGLARAPPAWEAAPLPETASAPFSEPLFPPDVATGRGPASAV
jgi:hypothetical protein